MRRAFHNVGLVGDDNIMYGVSLGSDFTAEHEWGIAGIKRKFGINDSKSGIKARKINKTGPIFYAENSEMCVLTSREPWNKKDEYTPEDLLASDISGFMNDNGLETAWDEGDFCVASNKPEDFKHIKELYDNFQKKNIAICFINASLPAFENASLSILVVDKLPTELTDAMAFADKKADDLIAYEKKIGVTKLKETKRGGYHEENYFMACSPRWIDYENPENREKKKKEYGTEYDIMFWVNYSDADDNYGWYTAEQIIKWLSTDGVTLKSLNKEKK